MRKTPMASDIIKEQTVKTLADLQVKYTSACNQVRNTLNDVDKQTLRNQANELEKEIRETENKLTSLESTDSNIQPGHSQIRRPVPVHRIDFRESMTTVKNIVREFGQEGGAALFLMQNCYPMAGECCIAQMRDFLKKETHPNNFRYFPIYLSKETQPNEYGLLNRLGGHVGIQFCSADLERHAQEIIGKICGMIQSGAIVFIVLNEWDILVEMQGSVLHQFLNLFWQPLVNKLPIENKRRIRFISVITSRGEISPSCREPSFCCTEAKFSFERILELPLRHWKYEDIQDWLETYSGWDAPQIDLFTQHIYNASMDGIPQLIYRTLLEHFQ